MASWFWASTSVSLNDERYKRSLGKGGISGQSAVWELRAPLDTSTKEKTKSFPYGLPELSEEEAEGRAPAVRGNSSLFSLYSCLAPAESAEPQGKCAGEPQLFGSNYGFAYIFRCYSEGIFVKGEEQNIFHVTSLIYNSYIFKHIVYGLPFVHLLWPHRHSGLPICLSPALSSGFSLVLWAPHVFSTMGFCSWVKVWFCVWSCGHFPEGLSAFELVHPYALFLFLLFPDGFGGVCVCVCGVLNAKSNKKKK